MSIIENDVPVSRGTNPNRSEFKFLELGEMVVLRPEYRSGIYPESMSSPMKVLQRLDGIRTIRVKLKNGEEKIVGTWDLEKV